MRGPKELPVVNRKNALLAAAAGVLAWWIYRQRATSAAAAGASTGKTEPVSLNLAPTTIVEAAPDSAAAIRDLAVQLGQDPNRIVAVDFIGNGVDASIRSKPYVENRKRIPGVPDIKYP